MKTCPSCGWNNPDRRTICVRCERALSDSPSAPTEANSNPFHTQPTPSPKAPAIIQARSKDCSAQIEQSDAALGKCVSSVTSCCALAGLLSVGINYITAILNDTPLDPPTTMQYIIAIAAFVIGGALSFKISKSGQVNLNLYRRYCATESLIVDSEKIYGSTATENFKLYYNMIEGVRCRPSAANASGQFQLGSINCDVLEIICTSRKVYTFYSFTNCNELKTIIEMNIANQRY